MTLPDYFAINSPPFSVELSLTSLGVRERQPVVWDTLNSEFAWNPDSLPGTQIAINAGQGVLELELSASSVWRDDVTAEVRIYLGSAIVPQDVLWASSLGRLVQRSSFFCATLKRCLV